jgi:peptidoglycan/xylan/chitin deacetylase (PgdA/CDA1 family)
MFLKRSLVVLTGILLFIGVFLLTFRLSDARLDNIFRQERAKYGVEGIVLTAAQPSFAVASTPAPAPTPATSYTPSSTPDTSSDSSTPPPPGAAPDTNVIIGPVPPSPSDMIPASAPTPDVPAPGTATPSSDTAPAPGSVPPSPDTTPAPSAPVSPIPNVDTNNGPIAPPSSTYVSPRTARWMSLIIGATETTASEATNSAPIPANRAPAAPVSSVATNAPTKSATATNQPATPTNQVSSAATGTNAAPASSPTATSINPAISSAPAHAVSVAGRAIVLGYHQFTGPGVPSKNPYSMSQDVFASEMKYLHDNGYNVVPLSDVVRFVKHEIGLPPNAVAITIDDGYKSALNYAAPVLKQYGYPWTYFVYPAFITRTEGKGAASWPDLVALDAEGVDVECHSMTHPQLTKHRQMFTETPAPNGGSSTITYTRSYHELSPQEYDDFLTNETAGAKAVLEKELHKKIKYFAYPYGDYNQMVETKAVAAGFEAIFTVADNPVHITTDVHSIGRYIITKPVERAFAGYLKQGALSLAQVDPAPGATTSNPEPVITAVLGFTGDPKTLETSVRDFGIVRHDFDPATSTVRLYLPHPLIQPTVLVSIRATDVQSGQVMVANWHFNYEPAGGAPAPIHPPISTAPTGGTPSTSTATPSTNAAPATNAAVVSAPATNTAVLSAKNSK